MSEPASRPQWFVYVLRTGAGHLYTGISTDPERRLGEHAAGRIGARSLRGKGPLTLLWQVAADDRAAASTLEARIKRMSKGQKEKLVAGTVSLESLISP